MLLFRESLYPIEIIIWYVIKWLKINYIHVHADEFHLFNGLEGPKLFHISCCSDTCTIKIMCEKSNKIHECCKLCCVNASHHVLLSLKKSLECYEEVISLLCVMLLRNIQLSQLLASLLKDTSI